MSCAVFYGLKSTQAIPLFLLSQGDFEKKRESFSAVERNAFTSQQFKGKPGQVCLIYNADGLVSRAYVGSGENNQILAMANAATRLPPGAWLPQDKLSETAMLYWALAQYRFTHYKQQDSEPRQLLVNEKDLAGLLAQASAVFKVRDLINMPANAMGPEELSMALAELAKTHHAHFDACVGEQLLKDNFPAIHAVGRAAAQAPRLLSLVWGDKKHPRISLIGKGVCFDSGGLDLKPSSAMRYMKKDMGGAAHVIGLADWIMTTGLPVYLEVLIPAVENAVSAQSFRPGDILRMRNGLTVEVDNTDAEGRLVLADAMVKACEDAPELLIDFATLTGAARVAVGTEIAAMFTNDDQLAQALAQSAEAVSDPVWRLPLFTNYESLLDSSVADLANSGSSPYAGAITAALFLQRFVPKKTSWVHFDVMAWNTSAKPGRPEGGEAMAIRAVADYLLKRFM